MRTDPSALDAVANFLIEQGSPGVVIKKREVWGYFADATENSAVRGAVERFLRGLQRVSPAVAEQRLRWRILKEGNWHRAWRRFFKPQRIGKLFWVGPPWIKPPSSGRRHIITIEPGMAFGTGTHATTRGCLEFIEKVAHLVRGAGFRALDVGTGSGILSIAMAKLGAGKICALDTDPVALKVARDNLRRNGVEDKIRLCATKVSKLRLSFPLVVANLTAETILEVANGLVKRVAPRGFLILSGILKTKAAAVERYFSLQGFSLVRRKGEKEWMTLLLRRK